MEPEELAKVQAKLDALKADYDTKLIKHRKAEEEAEDAWRVYWAATQEHADSVQARYEMKREAGDGR